MKSVQTFLTVLSLVTIGLFTVSCNEESSLTQKSEKTSSLDLIAGMSQEEVTQFNEKVASLPVPLEKSIQTRTPITYLGDLCSGPGTGVHNYKGSVGNLSLADYWSFIGVAGDVVTLDVDRVTCEMDPIAYVYLGSFGDSDDVCCIVTGSDDATGPACESCFAFGDPYVVFVLPATGVYTVAVMDFISCSGGPYTYTVSVSGNTCDTDGDGVYDNVDNCVNDPNPGQEDCDEDGAGDACDADDDNDGVDDVDDNCICTPNTDQANCDGDSEGDACDADDDNDGVADVDDAIDCSNTDATVNIDGCDSGVLNYVFPDGTTMMDHILACAAAAGNHGDFVSCVSALTNAWKGAGLISGAQKGAIQSCAGNSSWPL